MRFVSIPLVDTGQDFDFALLGHQYRGRRYTPGNFIDLDQFMDFDAQTNSLEYYFQNFLSPVDTIDLLEIVKPLSPTLWNGQRHGFGVVMSDLWIIR
jgi:hypothetical protein